MKRLITRGQSVSAAAVLRRYAAAHRALWTIDIHDYAAGLLEETPAWTAAHNEASDAHAALPRWLEPAAMVIDRRIIRDLDYFARTGQDDRGTWWPLFTAALVMIALLPVALTAPTAPVPPAVPAIFCPAGTGPVACGDAR